MAAFEDETGPDLDQFIGSKWTDWLGAIQSEPGKQQDIVETSSKRDVEVARLQSPDMVLFGYRPANDGFFLVVCQHCGLLVKPQSMIIHYERNHKNERITRLPPLCAKVRPTSSNIKHGNTDNHRILPSQHQKQSSHGAVSTQQKIPSHSVRQTPSTERSNKVLKTDVTVSSDKTSTSSEKEKRFREHVAKNHHNERSGMKLLSSPSHSKMGTSSSSSIHGNTLSQHTRHHASSSAKLVNKSGGTIQLENLPEFQVVTTSSNHSTTSKHHQRQNKSTYCGKSSDSDNSHNSDRKRNESSCSDLSPVNNKSKKNLSNFHIPVHHVKDTKSFDSIKIRIPSGEQRIPSINMPIVILEKTSVTNPSETVMLGNQTYAHTHKRPRPTSCDSDSSISPPQSKVPALSNPVMVTGSKIAPKAPPIVPNSNLISRAKRKEKRLLPLKAREYDPNKHCGVRLRLDNSHCTKSLTCKDHPLSAKRAVLGRCKKFDELVKDHGREKRRLKEKAVEEAAARLAPPVTKSVIPAVIRSPEPSITTTVLNTTAQVSQSSTSTAKTKSSITLFPRIYAAWHIDCWENEEVSEESSKPYSPCHCVQHHPEPITVNKFSARRMGSCQTSFSRKLERQLKALATNVHEFGTKLQKNSKPISFTPVGCTTYKDSTEEIKEILPTVPFLHHNKVMPSGSSQGSFQQPDRLPSGHSVMQHHPTVPRIFQNTDNLLMHNSDIINKGSKASNKNSARTKVNRKLSNLVPPSAGNEQCTMSDLNARNRSKSEQVNDLLRRTISNNSDSSHVLMNANQLTSTSPYIFLNDVTNDSLASPITLSSNVVPMTVNASSVTPSASSVNVNRSEKRNHTLARSSKVKSKSAIANYASATQAHIVESTRHESTGGSLQLPNGLNTIGGNMLMKRGTHTHSVTLSGNIGALTIPGDETTYAGNQIAQHLKNMNSNNNLVMQNEVVLSNDSPSTKSKHFCNSIAAPDHSSTALGGVTENSILLNGELFSLNQSNADSILRTVDFGQSNFSEPINLENPQELNSDLTENILRLQYSAPDHSDILQSTKLLDRHNFQLSNLSQLDQALEQFNTTSHLNNRLSLDATQGCSSLSSTTNSNRTTDISQNFLTQ